MGDLLQQSDGSAPTIYSNTRGTLSEADLSRISKYANISNTPISSQFTGAAKDYDIYISSKAKNFVSVSVLNRPQPADTGKAVLAHAGFSSRSQIIGIYKNGPEPKTFEVNDTIKLIKQGFIKNTGLEPGKKYYLTDLGNIELNPNPLYDTLLVVGTTNNNGDLIVDCHNSVNAHAGVKPVGYIKPLEEGQSPEYGYLAMSGTHKKNDYIALYNFLERCGELSSTTEDEFILDNPGYQIKYVDEGYADTSIPRVPYLKLTGKFSSETNSKSTLGLNPQTSDCSLAIVGQGYDISSLAYWSPMGINSATTDVNLSSFDIHLSVELEAGKNVEIYPGFHQYESNVYGFNWVVKFNESANKYVLKVDTGDEGNFGIAYIADPKTAPTLLNNKNYEIYVSRRDAGYTSLDIVNSVLQLTRQDFDPNSTLPISGKALSSAGITSKLEAKKVLGTSRAIVPSDYGELASNFDLTNEEYKDLLQDDTIASKALYEINSIIYKYKNDHSNAKPFIGILIDQLRKIVDDKEFDANHSHILINDDSNLQKYDLTPEQKEDIEKVLNLLTNDKDSAQVVSSSIGLLIKAAGETQKRLLNIESALFGRDYETLPDSETQKGTSDVYPSQDTVSPFPARIGITRLVNALSKETLGSDNPTGDAANPDNSSNNNRIKDLYKQIEGSNGDYGETGIELNLLTGEDNSFVNSGNNTDAGQHGTGAIEDSKNEISKGTFNTYPSVNYGTESGTQLTAPEKFEYNNESPVKPSNSRTKYNIPLKGINDAINRIMYKLNMLTGDIHGYDDILSKPVRLDNIRSRLNIVFSDSYVKKSTYFNINRKIGLLDSINEPDPINSLVIASDDNNYNPDFNPLNLPKLDSIRTIYFNDLYTKWAGETDDQRTMDPFTDAGSICEDGTGTVRTPIIELIKSTIGNPKAFSSNQQSSISDPEKYKSFVASRNIHSHSERLYNLENAVDTLITALFHGTNGANNAKADDTYSNLSEIIDSSDDTNEKADITGIQSEWKVNNGFKTLNKLIYGGDTPSSENNVIQTIIRELTGANTKVDNFNSFTTSTPVTFIDTFKKFLETNHYSSLNNVTAESLNTKLIAADYIFDLTANGINYNSSSVLSQNDLKNRNIFYAKASENIIGSTDNFVKAYRFRAGVVYQFYKSGTKFGLVNDYTEITLAAGESITVHGQNAEAYKSRW